MISREISNHIEGLLLECSQVGYPQSSMDMRIFLDKVLDPYNKALSNGLKMLDRYGDRKSKDPSVVHNGQTIEASVNRQDLREIGKIMNALKGLKVRL